MSEFTPDWLALREPADAAARSSRLTSLLAARFGRDAVAVLNVLDIATGTGANVRYLVEHLPPEQRWLLVDHDPVLLAQAPDRIRAWAVARGFAVTDPIGELQLRRGPVTCRVRTRRLDLAGDVATIDADVFDRRALVTASALLDLVSEPWLYALARRCRQASAAVLFALTYNGHVRCSPDEPADETIRSLVNAHTRTDKGFGPALGASAPAAAARCFADAGYDVQREPSDWVLGPGDQDLQTQLIEGWAGAAAAIAPERALSIEYWKAQRLAHVVAGRSRLMVGHDDLIAWP